MDSSTSAHDDDDEMLALTLENDVSDRRPPSKLRDAETSTAFEPFAREHADQHETLSIPLTLPASPTLLPLATSPSSTTTSDLRVGSHLRYLALDRQSVTISDPYFQSATGDFNAEMQKSNDEYRRLSDVMNLNVLQESSGGHSGLGPPLRTSKKRKQGTNVSIDLQTKIRIIEVAEQYQYDPKSSNRSKHDSDAIAGFQGKGEMVNGIRLAEQFGLNKSTVSRILKRKEEFKKAYYKDNISGCSKHINKKSKFDKLNRLVENWFDMNREKHGAITDTVIRDIGKKYADELGIEDFRGSNGWVRSLRNRKEHTARNNVSIAEQEAEQKRKDREAIERIRNIFPSGVKDMASFFKDLSTYLEKDGVSMRGFEDLNGSNTTCSTASGDSTKETVAALAGAACTEIDAVTQDVDGGSIDEEFLKKKMIESLRVWSQELMTLELTKFKKRMKAREAAIL